ncbi:MAG: type 2 lantipeptide synthetase LanM [Phycisphaera sp.]|nr:type 2 lantipeptide synthetase LanM [Phycisphaera sp.]
MTQKTVLDWEIVAGALTLPERFALYRDMPSGFSVDSQRAEMLLDRWSGLLGRDSEQGVADRLADLGFTVDDLPKVLGSIDPAAANLLGRSSWMEACEEALAWEGDLDENGIPTAEYLNRDDEDPFPFEHALVPWVEVATKRLRRRRPELDAELSEEVLRDEQRGLLESLATFARDSNASDFSGARLEAYDANEMAMGMFMQEPPRDVYLNTVRGMIGSEMQDWMKRYPALARLLGVRVEAWSRAVGELLDRIESDRGLIAGRFNGGREIGGLTKARFGRGDSHNGGRSVAILEFDSGLELVYKPRSLMIDEASQSMLGMMNSFLDPECRIRVPEAMDRGLYGWAEFIEPRACEDDEDLKTFHLRMGVLLGIVHLLQGNDFHLENVIANGSMPVPIDLETISVPTAQIDPDEELDEVIDPAEELVSKSVLGTLLLPSAMAIGKQRDLRQLGALRVEIPGKSKTRKIRKLSMVITDFQRWVSTDDDSNERPNSEPWIEGGDKVDASDYLDETKRGYRIFYEAMRSHRQEIGEGFSALEDAWVRVLNRATNVYFRLLLESCDSTLMKSGVDRWVHLQRLGLSLQGEATKEGKETLSHLVVAEVESLLEGDIAYFSARGGGIDYAVTDPVTGGYLKMEGPILGKSARQRAEEQLARMSPEDLEIQIRFQGDAYRSTLTSLSRLLHDYSDSSPSADELPETFVQEDKASLEKRVITGLDQLLDQRIQRGAMTNWLGLDSDSVREIITPTALKADLYSGRGGLSLLFEKAYRVLGDRRYLDVACSTMELEMASHRRHGAETRFLQTSPDGYGVWGGLTAALWAIGRHEGMGEYRDLSLKMVESLTERNIRKDESFDVISGAAGAMLLILGLNEEEKIPGVHEIVGRLADHLVRNRIDDEGPGWQMFKGDRAVCGLGHGRSGVALALIEAGKALGRKDLQELALAAFHGEHGLRGDNVDQGWPDLRGVRMGSMEPSGYGSHVWCNGLEGIALARAAALHVIDDSILRDDLEFSLLGINKVSRSTRYHLCCGRAGRVVTLGSLRRLLPEADIIDPLKAISTMARGIDTVDTEVVFGLNGPGLLQGHSGAIWAGLSLLDDQDAGLLLSRI